MTQAFIDYETVRSQIAIKIQPSSFRNRRSNETSETTIQNSNSSRSCKRCHTNTAVVHSKMVVDSEAAHVEIDIKVQQLSFQKWPFQCSCIWMVISEWTTFKSMTILIGGLLYVEIDFWMDGCRTGNYDHVQPPSTAIQYMIPCVHGTFYLETWIDVKLLPKCSCILKEIQEWR